MSSLVFGIGVGLFMAQCVFQVGFAQEPSQWKLIPGQGNRDDAALRLAIADVVSAAAQAGITVTESDGARPASVNRILVGDAARNALVAAMVRDGIVELKSAAHPQGFEMRTVRDSAGNTTIVVAGGAVVGDVYGVYWLWDRIRVFKAMPELNLVRTPALGIRAGGGLRESSLKQALRYTVNWAVGVDGNALVSWDSDPLRSANEKNREETQPLIALAHALHMKYLAYVDEFSCHPDDLRRFGASQTPSDPKLWDMLQDKYRRLFTAMPELDGICIRTGELTRVAEPLIPYNVMHEPADVAGWPLERRYRQFLRKMHDVVVGEFDKIYFHRTWVTNTTEQHSDPDVYRAIFTDEAPTDNLYLSPYLTLGDRWFYQPINPTFNLTPHKMLVLLAPMNYHEQAGVNIFPTFPGLYFREGFDRLWRDRESNIAGSHFWSEGSDGWGSNELTAYTAFRMSWDPLEDPRRIAEDFAAIHFGRDAAKTMGEVIMLSGEAYKHGLYVKPVAESIRGNTLPQLRLTTFPVQGFPALDHGKAHLKWLHQHIHLPSKPAMADAIQHIDLGLSLVERMLAMGKEATPAFDDQQVAARVLESLELARLLILTNNAYIKTCYAYFDYRDTPTDTHKNKLELETARLKDAVEQFQAAPGFAYKLYGVAQLIESASAMLADRSAAERMLENAPDESEIADLIRERQDRDRDLLAQLGLKAVKILHWKGMVDGKDILHIRGDTVRIEHIAADPIQHAEATFSNPLPERPVTVFLNNIRSPEIHPFVLEQPTEDNGFTAKVYLFDQPPGYGLWEFEAYYIEKY